MIEYCLENSVGDTFSLNSDTVVGMVNRKSLTLTSDYFSIDNKIVEKSGEAGSSKLGSQRYESRELGISFQRVHSSCQDYRDAENSLLSFMTDLAYLVDVTCGKKIKVAITAYSSEYDAGSYQMSGSVDITLTALNPFWEATEATVITSSVLGGDSNEITVDNEGYLAAPAEIEFVASEECATLQIYISENKQGIEIIDSILGSEGFETLTIDNGEGTVVVGTLDRTQSISAGTGYFKLPVGSSTLKVVPAGDGDITLTWYERTFI